MAHQQQSEKLAEKGYTQHNAYFLDFRHQQIFGEVEVKIQNGSRKRYGSMKGNDVRINMEMNGGNVLPVNTNDGCKH